MTVVPLGQAESRIVHEARGTVREVGDRRKHPRWLRFVLELPESFGHPGPSNVVSRQALVRHRPARLAPFDEVHDPRRIATVTIVVPGEQVSEVVEGQLLRIPYARREDFELGTVGVHPKDRASPGPSDGSIREPSAIGRE